MITRRRLIAGSMMLPAVGLASVPHAAGRLVATLRDQLDRIRPGPALLASYPDPAANAAYPAFAPANNNAAYIYDNALAGLALAASGHPLQASRIADALALAQQHDPDYHDGRLRNAYRAGSVSVPIALPGWWDARAKLWAEDPYQVGSETGPIAWAILLWTALRDAGVNSTHYDHAAHRAASWIVTHCRNRQGFTGGLFGFPPHPEKLTWVSTEQNTDLAVVFTRLARPHQAAHAASFVRAMQNPQTHLFAAGLTPNGTRNPLIAADANLWPTLAGLTDRRVIAPTIARLGHPHGHPSGIGFTTASRGIWTEGTAFAALALRRAGDQPRARRFLATAHAQIAPDGELFATPDTKLVTGLTIGPNPGSKPFNYDHVPALAPTAWTVLAALDFNPLGSK